MLAAIAERRLALLRSTTFRAAQAGPSRHFAFSATHREDSPFANPSPASSSTAPTPTSQDHAGISSHSPPTQSSSSQSAVDAQTEYDEILAGIFSDTGAASSDTPSAAGASTSTTHGDPTQSPFSRSRSLRSGQTPHTHPTDRPAGVIDGPAERLSPESFGTSSRPTDHELDITKSLENLFSKYTPRASTASSASAAQWTPEALNTLRGPKYDPDAPTVSPRAPDRTPPARKLRGVHDRHRRALGQTPHEAKAFDEVLAGIFADLERHGSRLGRSSNPSTDPFGVNFGEGASRWQQALRRRTGSSDRSETTPKDQVLEELDRLKEEMSCMATDAELLEWAEGAVFKPVRVEDGYPVYSEAYPHILSALLRTVRVNFNNPNLALALFQHAQSISLESYIAGCLTGAYNELIAIRWDSFKDLEGVEAAAREMDVNGVGWDRRTRQLVAKVCEFVTGSMVGQHPAGAGMWGDGAEHWLRALEERIEGDIVREKEILRLKMRQEAAPKRAMWGVRRAFDYDGESDEERMRAAA